MGLRWKSWNRKMLYTSQEVWVGWGGGDCDSDKDCRAGLKCGNNNCHRDFEFLAHPENDCCYDPKQNGVCDGKLGTTTCCTPDKKCGLGGGDCDSDKDCKAGLKCGNNNCHRDFLTSAHLENDCCYDPKQKVCDGN